MDVIYCPEHKGSWCCTKEEGHSGIHVATNSMGGVCASWGRNRKSTNNEIRSMLAELVAVLDTCREHDDDYSHNEPLSVREACDRARKFL